MSIHITQIGKHKFVCGLFWQSLSRPRELQREAIDLAKRIDFDLMMLRKDHSMAQAGYANTRDGARRGMFSLAAIVSKTLAIEGAQYDGRKQPVHNWLSAFKLPDGMWAYFAVRDANFLPNGDFAGTKEEVLDRLHGDYGLGGWNIVIGDPELEDQGFHNFLAKSVEDFIPHKKNGQIRAHQWWALTAVERQIPWMKIIAASAIAATAGSGGFAWWKYDQKQKEEAARALALEAERARMLGNEAPTILPHPWPTKPLPALLANACMEKLNMAPPGGWSLDEYVCTASNVTYLWARKESTIDLLLQQVPSANVEISGNKASYAEPIKLDVGKDEALQQSKEVLQRISSRLQLLGLKPTITNVPTPIPPDAAKQKAAAVADWQTFAITLNIDSMAPTIIAEIFNEPGVRLDKLSYRNGGWSIEGVIYAK